MGIRASRKLSIPTFNEKSNVEYCYFMGCKTRNNKADQNEALDFMRVLNDLGVSFAILAEEEWCCGEPLRNNVGDDTLFRLLVQRNISCMENAGIKKIITFCPNCYKILKNDYNQLGGEFEVVPHTDLLDHLSLKERLLYTTTKKASSFSNLILCHACDTTIN